MSPAATPGLFLQRQYASVTFSLLGEPMQMSE
jgi:hypothetical protein